MIKYNFYLLAGFFVLNTYLLPSSVQAAEFCSDAYYIDVTLSDKARWDMCWEHRNREGIVLHKIHYTPANGQRRLILSEAAMAQIHVPYDDNGARYHDISDFGLGADYMSHLRAEECPDGQLLKQGNKSIVCMQTAQRGVVFAHDEQRENGEWLSLFSVSSIGAYNYIPLWRFFDDGSIDLGVGATGALQRFGNEAKEKQGWLMANGNIGIAHIHNFFWKLDFDLNGSNQDDYVEELNWVSAAGSRELHTTRFYSETARRVSPQTLRRWRIVDSNLRNASGQPASYEIRLHQAEHQDIGPAFEPFTHNDFYVTRHKSCERFASRNPSADGCANNLADFTDGEAIGGQDLVLWPSTTFYHMPRSEDAPLMDAHWSFVSLTARDWHDSHPLAIAGNGGGQEPPPAVTPPPSPTPTPPPPEPPEIETPVPPPSTGSQSGNASGGGGSLGYFFVFMMLLLLINRMHTSQPSSRKSASLRASP